MGDGSGLVGTEVVSGGGGDGVEVVGVGGDDEVAAGSEGTFPIDTP
jgi:hypothetical protein